MTYNVWSREDIVLYRRMQAIGRLVEKHSPDVILFQVEKQRFTRSDLNFLFHSLVVDQAGLFSMSGGYALHPQDLSKLRMVGGLPLLAGIP
jgi:hypothetical protein